MIDVPPRHLKAIRNILAQHVPHCEVRAFGSRLRHTAKKHSDLDIVIMGSGKIRESVLDNLKESFQESDLPFRVDISDWATTSKEFQKVIEKDYFVIKS